MLVANQGIRREALVEPSTGSSTARSGHLRGAVAEARLLAQHPEAGIGEHADGGRVRHEVGAVLPGSRPGKAPVGEPLQGSGDRLGRGPENLQQIAAHPR